MKKITVISSWKLTAQQKLQIAKCIHDYINPPFGTKPNHILVFANGEYYPYHEKNHFPNKGKNKGRLLFKRVPQAPTLLFEIGYLLKPEEITDAAFTNWGKYQPGKFEKIKVTEINNVIAGLNMGFHEKITPLFQGVSIQIYAAL